MLLIETQMCAASPQHSGEKYLYGWNCELQTWSDSVSWKKMIFKSSNVTTCLTLTFVLLLLGSLFTCTFCLKLGHGQVIISYRFLRFQSLIHNFNRCLSILISNLGHEWSHHTRLIWYNYISMPPERWVFFFTRASLYHLYVSNVCIPVIEVRHFFDERNVDRNIWFSWLYNTNFINSIQNCVSLHLESSSNAFSRRFIFADVNNLHQLQRNLC